MADAPLTASAAPDEAQRTADILGRYRGPVIEAMRGAVDRANVAYAGLIRAHLGWEGGAGGGKMLRPALLLLCCEAAGGDARTAIPAAAAVELLHNFTLIHDDIEDASETRHGRPTLWRDAGVPLAINAGDGLFAIARRTLLSLSDRGVLAERVLAAARSLDDACIALCEGQHLDLSFETRATVTLAECEAMIAGKTAALLGAACAIGAIVAGGDERTVGALERCGREMGMAFQIQDDVLGAWGASEVTGKPVADDIRARKKSFPVAYAFEHLDGDRRDRLASLYGDSVGDDGVREVLALLDDAGARAAAQDAARRHADAALAAIAPLAIDADRRDDIAALASYFVRRDA